VKALLLTRQPKEWSAWAAVSAPVLAAPRGESRASADRHVSCRGRAVGSAGPVGLPRRSPAQKMLALMTWAAVTD
jgi:hypothetical protein